MTRIKALRILMVGAMLIISARLFFIQVIEYDKWVEAAAAQHTSEATIAAKRGSIYMMDGEEPVAVVMNNTVYTVIVDPMVAKREKVEALVDSVAGEYRSAEWDDVFRDTKRRYYIVAKNVPHAAAQKIREAGLGGLWFKEGNARVYPEGEMGAQLLGFVNVDGVGQYGVEGMFNTVLAGKNGMMRSVVDVNNVALSIGDDNVLVPAQDGQDVVLSIDKNIQSKVEEILRKAASGYGKSTRVAAIVMDPKDARVLAMANVPTYDPANYGYVAGVESYTNYTTEVAFEPASVCKTFVFAAGVDTGVMTPETTFNNTGGVVVDGFRIGNASNVGRGIITMQYGLNWSLNTSSVYALTLLSGTPGSINAQGREKMYDYYHNHFGLGSYTGVELVESAGTLTGPNANIYGLDLTYANMTFGQGLNATMVQVTSAYSALVNGGIYHTPTVVAGIRGADGKLVEYKSAGERNKMNGQRVVSEATSATMRQMLWGTRSLMRTRGIDKAGYYIGGKSGTAQTIEEDGSYSDPDTGDTIATYMGFGGAAGEEPAYVAMVKIWGESQKFSGTYSARPLFNEISQYLLDYLQIEPKR